MPSPTQEIDLSNIVNASSSIPLSSVTTTLLNVTVTATNPFYLNKKYPPSVSSVAILSGIAQVPTINLPVTAFYSSASAVVNVSTGYLILSSAGTVTLSAYQDGINSLGTTVCLSATASKSVSVYSYYKNSNW